MRRGPLAPGLDVIFPCILAADVERWLKKTRTFPREGRHEQGSRRLPRPVRSRDGLSVEPPLQHARASRRASDLSCRWNASPHRCLRRAMASHRRLHCCRQPLGTTQFCPDRRRQRRDLLRALRQPRMVCSRCGPRPQPAVRPHLFQAHGHARQAYSPIRGAGLRRTIVQQPRLRTQAADRQLL